MASKLLEQKGAMGNLETVLELPIMWEDIEERPRFSAATRSSSCGSMPVLLVALFQGF